MGYGSWASHLHQGAESAVVYDLKWLLTLYDPTYKLSADNLHLGFQLYTHQKKTTML